MFQLPLRPALSAAGQRHLDAERSALVDLRVEHINLAVVIILHYAARQGQPEPPSSLLGGISGRKDRLIFAAGYSFARVAHIYHHLTALLKDVEGDLAVTLYGVHGILRKILYHPLKEGRIQHRNYFVFLIVAYHLHMIGLAMGHIFHRIVYHSHDVRRLELRRGTDLGEALRY